MVVASANRAQTAQTNVWHDFLCEYTADQAQTLNINSLYDTKVIIYQPAAKYRTDLGAKVVRRVSYPSSHSRALELNIRRFIKH